MLPVYPALHTPIPAGSFHPFFSSGQCLLLSVDQFKSHLLCKAVPGPPCYMRPPYVLLQLGTHFLNTSLSVLWSLSSPSDFEWLQDGRCLPHLCFPSTKHWSLKINTVSNKWQNEPESRERIEFNHGTKTEKSCIVHWDCVPLEWIRKIHRRLKEDNLPHSKCMVMGEC